MLRAPGRGLLMPQLPSSGLLLDDVHDLAQRSRSPNVKKSPWSHSNFLLQGSPRGLHQLPALAILPPHTSLNTCLLLTLATGVPTPSACLECCVSDTQTWSSNDRTRKSETAASDPSQQVWTQQTRAGEERAAAAWPSRKWPEVSHDLLPPVNKPNLEAPVTVTHQVVNSPINIHRNSQNGGKGQV